MQVAAEATQHADDSELSGLVGRGLCAQWTGQLVPPSVLFSAGRSQAWLRAGWSRGLPAPHHSLVIRPNTAELGRGARAHKGGRVRRACPTETLGHEVTPFFNKGAGSRPVRKEQRVLVRSTRYAGGLIWYMIMGGGGACGLRGATGGPYDFDFEM